MTNAPAVEQRPSTHPSAAADRCDMDDAPDSPPTRLETAAIWGLTLLLGLAMWTQLDDAALRTDEFIGLITAQRPLVESLLQQEDYGAPLYNLVLRVLIGDQQYPPEWLLRLPAMIASVLCVPAAWWLVRNLFGRTVALCTVALMAINPWYLHYAVEARAYSMFILLSVVSMGLFLRVLRGGGFAWRLAYVLATTLLVYAHYYGTLCIAAQGIYVVLDGLMLRQPVRRIAARTVPVLLTIVLVIPAVYLMLRFVAAGSPGTVAWPRPVTPWNSLLRLGELVDIEEIGALLLIPILCALWPWRTAWDSERVASWWQRRRGPILLVVWVLLGLGTLLLISMVYRPMYARRYGMPMLVPLLALAVAFLYRVSRPGLVLAVLLVGASNTHHSMLVMQTGPGMNDAVAWIQKQLDQTPSARLMVANWSYCEGFINPELVGMRYYGLRDEPVELLELNYPNNISVRDPELLQRPERLLVLTFESRDVISRQLDALGRPHSIEQFGFIFVIDAPELASSTAGELRGVGDIVMPGGDSVEVARSVR